MVKVTITMWVVAAVAAYLAIGVGTAWFMFRRVHTALGVAAFLFRRVHPALGVAAFLGVMWPVFWLNSALRRLVIWVTRELL